MKVTQSLTTCKGSATKDAKRVTRLDSVRLVFSALLSGVPVVMLNTVTVLASNTGGSKGGTGSGDFGQLNKALTEMADQGKGILIGVIAITIVVVGLCFALPVRRLNEFAKEHVFAIILGAILICGGTAIATSIAGAVDVFGK